MDVVGELQYVVLDYRLFSGSVVKKGVLKD